MPKKRWSSFTKNPCPACHGTGEVRGENNARQACEPCGGTGRGPLPPPEETPDDFVVTSN